MATLSEYTFRVLNNLAPILSDDFFIDEREVKFAIHEKRHLFIKQDITKNHSINPDVIQDLGCVDLEAVDSAHCCEITFDCKIIRTEEILPRFIETQHETGLTRVASLDKLSAPFSIIPFEAAPFAGNGRFNKKSIFVFPLNGRIYFTYNPSNLWARGVKKVNISGVFEDPTKVWDYLNTKYTGNTNFTPYSDATSEYPMKGWMGDAVVKAVTDDFIKRLITPIDNTNDSKSNPTPVTQK